MLVLGAKLEGTKEQYEKLNEAIHTARFVELAKSLNYLASQVRAERA